jgi:hypothetical protein
MVSVKMQEGTTLQKYTECLKLYEDVNYVSIINYMNRVIGIFVNFFLSIFDLQKFEEIH